MITSNRRLEDEIKHLSEKLVASEKSAQEEYDRKFEELKQMYSEQIEKQKKLYMGNSNDQDVIEQLRDELRKLAHDKILNEEMI